MLLQEVKHKLVDNKMFDTAIGRYHNRCKVKNLYCEFAKLIKKYRRDSLQEDMTLPLSDYIFVCWWQGEADMSPMIRECYQRIKQFNTDKKVIVLEDLTKIKQSTSKHKNGIKRTKHNNMISQVPFYMLKCILSFKALHVGKRVETVDPAYTSQTNCLTHEKDGIRKGCRYCCKDNLVLDADWNASINIAFKKHPISFNLPLDGRLNLMGRVRQQPHCLESNL